MTYKLLIEYNIEDNQAITMDMDEQTPPRDLIMWGWDHFQQQPIYAPADAPLLANKFDSHGNHKRKVRFESQLAIAVLENASLFLPMLTNIRRQTVLFLEKQREWARTVGQEGAFLLKTGSIFSYFLYPTNKHYGRLGDQQDAPADVSQLYFTGLDILTNGKDIPHLLTALMALPAILTKIPSHFAVDRLWQEKDSILKHSLATKALFDNRGKYITKKNSDMLTETCGITAQRDRVPHRILPHYRALDHTTRDTLNVSAFAYTAYQREIPFVSGASGHTVLLLRSVLNFDINLSQDELQQFAFISAAFLIMAGAHSFHEVFSVAQNAGVTYDIGRYESAIPLVFKESFAYQGLLKDFPDVIVSAKDADRQAVKLDSRYTGLLFFAPSTRKRSHDDFGRPPLPGTPQKVRCAAHKIRSSSS